MVTVREIRAAAQMIGRRNALRYLAIGVGASLVAACGGKGKDDLPGAPAALADPAAGGTSSGDPAPASSGVVARAFDAFIKGDWNLESTTPNGKTVKGKATVNADGGGNSGWSIAWTDGPSWTGGWLLRGGHLVLDVYEAPKASLSRLTGGQALTVPNEVGDNVSLTLPGSLRATRTPATGRC